MFSMVGKLIYSNNPHKLIVDVDDELGKYTVPSGKEISLAAEIDHSVMHSKLYADDSLFFIHDIHRFPKISVVNETITQAAKRMISEGIEDIVALNFASARNVGGGFLAGAIAQEEDLCRASALYACMKNKPMFYNENILCDNSYYTHNVVYSPNVPFFRDDYLNLLEEPYHLSIVSAPAPNVRSMASVNENILYKTLLTRAKKILSVAHVNDHKNIILGAWGCGAFGNDPEMVSKVFMEALKDIPVFENVCFAVYDNRPDQPIYNFFKNIIK